MTRPRDILIVANLEEARRLGFDSHGQRMRPDGSIQLAFPINRVAHGGEIEGLAVDKVVWTSRASVDPRALQALGVIRRAQAKTPSRPKHRGPGGTSEDRDPISQARCIPRPGCPRCHAEHYRGRHRA